MATYSEPIGECSRLCSSAAADRRSKLSDEARLLRLGLNGFDGALGAKPLIESQGETARCHGEAAEEVVVKRLIVKSYQELPKVDVR